MANTVPDTFWADTDTSTLYELLETKDVFDTPEPEEFERTIRAELRYRGMPQERFQIKAAT